MHMRVIFVTPPPILARESTLMSLQRRLFATQPLGICYLAAAVEKANHEVAVLDCEASGLMAAELVKKIRSAPPDLFAFSATSSSVPRVTSVAQTLKTAFPQAKFAIGGSHVSLLAEVAFGQMNIFDFGAIGDGEDLIVELLEAIGGDRALGDIPGLLWRKDGEVIKNPPRPLELEIDRYPVPARHLLTQSLYRASVPGKGSVQTAAVIVARGCPFKCVFCAAPKLQGGRVRFRSPEAILEELQYIRRTLGITHISFYDDCLTLNRRLLVAVCEGMLANSLDLTWEGYARADTVDADILGLMQRAGAVRLSFGVESGNPKVLASSQKGETLEQMAEAISLTKQAGISTKASFVLGLPDETQATAEETIRFACGLNDLDLAGFSVLAPFPGTEVVRMIEQGSHGYRQVEKGELYGSSGYDGVAKVEVNDLSAELLLQMQKSAFRRFYLSPLRIYRNVCVMGIGGLLSGIKDAVAMMRFLRSL